MFLRHIIVFGIFAWYTQVSGEHMVNCERYPFHSSCRGVMLRKREMRSNGLRDQGCDDFRDDIPCSELKSSTIDDDQRRRRINNPSRTEYGTFPRSRLWMSLLDNGLNSDNPYDFYASNYERHHKKRKNSEKEKLAARRIPPLQFTEFLSELDSSDSDY
ncbi:uncharacterized protein [Prorops nasuta]|uniref:uncharacterized protein n=1 Tax=Prorops nasuta TaxID=863751 RepID=UPI0034CE9614